MRFCIDCGAAVERTATRCAACGFELPRAEPVEFELPRIEQVEIVRKPVPLGWEYSWPAELLLWVARVCIWPVVAFEVCRVAVLVPIIVFQLKSSDPAPALLFAAIRNLFCSLVLLIVLTRVRLH